MTDEQKNHTDDPFDYMEELSKAYREAFSKRIAGKTPALSEEKRGLILKMQSDLSRIAGRLALSFREEEKKELARMLKESAEEILTRLSPQEEPTFFPDPTRGMTTRDLLSRATILANRCLNLLIRHGEAEHKLFFLLTSELSALYAIAALN